MNNNNSNQNSNSNNNIQTNNFDQLLDFDPLYPLSIDQLNFFLEIPLLRVDTLANLEGPRRIMRYDDDFIVVMPRQNQRRDSQTSPRHKNQNYEKYMQKRRSPLQNERLDDSQPYIKVTVLRNMNPNTPHNSYFINEYGLVGSQKTADSEDILIGRFHRNSQQDVIPNDINLPEDRIISRIHCKIVCKDYFRKGTILNSIYQNTLNALKVKQQKKIIQLPNNVIYLISQFLQDPKIAYIQDLGSVCGTQMRVFKNDPHILQQDQKFNVGSETTFTINLCHTLKCENLKPIDDNWFELIHKVQATNQLKYEIHFSDENLKHNYTAFLEKGIFPDQDCQVLDELKKYNIPFIIILFSGSGIDMNKNHQLFIGNQYYDSKEFFIGRGQDNNVKISSNTISRKQSRFRYSIGKQSWVIYDGSSERESANGTWVQLSTQEQSTKKTESNLVQLYHNAEIKISDYILKIELHKGKNKNQKQLLQQLLND